MNILQVINVRWFNAEAAYAYSLAKGLTKKGHKVIILGLPQSPVTKKAKSDAISVYETANLNSYNPVKVFKSITEMVSLINRESINVINCHRSEGYAMVAAASRLSKTKPVLIRTRGDVRPVRGGIFNKTLYTTFADGVISSGEVVKKGLVERLGLAEEKVDVIYAAVDTDKFRSLNNFNDIRREFGISFNSPLIAILGRIDEVKGHKYFIEAALLILKEYPSATFLIIAKEVNEEMNRLKEQVKGNKLVGKVFFTGFREDISDVMASCNIGVVTSIGSETNCRVVLEWMAMGKPVVGTTVGVIPEVIRDKYTGYLVPPKDSKAIAKAVGSLLSNKEMAVSFGRVGRKLAETIYNEALFVEKTLEVYRKALEANKKEA